MKCAAHCLCLVTVGVLGSAVELAAFEPAKQEIAASPSALECHIPFDNLQSKARSCTESQPKAGQRCEPYSRSQFPEVVLINTADQGTPKTCTGTVIAARWVLTAAHCFLGATPTRDKKGDNRDLIVRPADTEGLSVHISAANAKIAQAEKNRGALRIIVHGSYAGWTAGQTDRIYENDLALVELDQPFPPAVQPASLAAPDSFSQSSTIAGYGYSNAGDAIDWFYLTWPPRLSLSKGVITFQIGDGSDYKSAFCVGDSGGPVFAGRYRGCRPDDRGGEPRPRSIQGVISYIAKPGIPPLHAQSATEKTTHACRNASTDVMQSVTLRERHTWICDVTAKEAGGC